MKRTHKRILGFFGLVLVAVMTIFAAMLPTTEALAMNTSVTDKIVVTVTRGIQTNFVTPLSGYSFVDPEQEIQVIHNDVTEYVVKIRNVEDGSIKLDDIIWTGPTDAGTNPHTINFSAYPYGEYELRVQGTNTNIDPAQSTEEDIRRVHYLPVIAHAKEREDDPDIVDVTLEYDDNNDDIDHFIINVYDKDGNIVDKLSPTRVPKGETKVELPFNNLPNGDYTISTSAIDKDGKIIYKAYDTIYRRDVVNVPNTGGFFQNLNISKSDYLITGLIIFFIVGLAGAIFIARNNKSSRK